MLGIGQDIISKKDFDILQQKKKQEKEELRIMDSLMNCLFSVDRMLPAFKDRIVMDGKDTVAYMTVRHTWAFWDTCRTKKVLENLWVKDKLKWFGVKK